MIQVIIPSRTDEYLDRLLASIERSEEGAVTQGGRRIIVGDNGLSPTTRAAYPHVHFVPVPQPFVFANAINLCLHEGRRLGGEDQDVMVLNDDTEVLTPDFFVTLERVLRSPEAQRYGIISPIIRGGVGNPDQWEWVGTSGTGLRQTRTTVCFLSAVIRREVLATIGDLDPRFTGYGCLNAEARVLVEGGRTLRIDTIVNQRLPVRVLSRNATTGMVEAKPVTAWWKSQGPKGQPWVKVKLEKAHARQGVVFTPDHRVLTEAGWVEAKDLRAGDRVYIHESRLGDNLREFILGSLLGDGSVESRHGRRAGFTVSHARSQWGYLDLKRQILGDLVTSVCEWERQPVGQTQRKISTVYTAELADLRDLVYQDGRKVARRDWLKDVGPFGLAVFFMDDGTNTRDGQSIRFSAHDFDDASVELIAERLFELGITSTIDRDNRTERYTGGRRPCLIRLRKAETEAFGALVGAFVPPDMRYKLRGDAPAFQPSRWEPDPPGPAHLDRVRAVDPFVPKSTWIHLQRTRYCLSVEDNENFFTIAGLAHNCEDSDFCRRTVEAGWLLGVTGEAVLAHGIDERGFVQSSTYRALYSAEEHGRMSAEARRIFEAKWGPGPELGAYSTGGETA